jgi:hypothetical protein
LKKILLWISSGKEERKWVNIVSLVGLFEIEWKTPHHNILFDFLNNWKLEQNHKKRIRLNSHKVMMADE